MWTHSATAGKADHSPFNLAYSIELRARAECPFQAFQKDTRVWKDQHLLNGSGSTIWEANRDTVRTSRQLAAVQQFTGFVSDCGILFPGKCMSLISSSSSSIHWCAPLGAEEGPTSVGISLQAPGRLMVVLESCSEAWGPLPHYKTSAPAVISYSSSDKIKINLQLCCRRYKRTLGWASHAFFLLQSDHQSPQNVLICLTSSHWRTFIWL